MPWTLVSENKLKQTFTQNWTEQHNYTRLFALGVDAYHIIHNLAYLGSHTKARFAGETGNIYIDSNNRLHRELLWAKFRNGIPVYIDNIITPTEGTHEADKS